LNRLSALEPAEPVRRYERDNPGELIHIDIKKLGRFQQIGQRITGDRTRQSSRRGDGWGAGSEFANVCIDDASGLAFSQILPNEKKQSAVAFLKAAVAYYQSLGVNVERVMTDNRPCYKSFAFRQACKQLGLKHLRTRPYTPNTNGKAERFIQTCLREWAYAKAYQAPSNVVPNCQAGCIDTIGIAHTATENQKHPLADSVLPRTTSRSGPTTPERPSVIPRPSIAACSDVIM
jgi:transposase InsO family protein